MLKYQFTARHKFNKAERINSAIWFISVVTALSAFFPKMEDYAWMKCILITLDIVMLILLYVCNYSVSMAADLRAVFDDYVLGIKNLEFDKSKMTKLNEVVVNTIKRNNTVATIQMSNTGNDTPPGVKDWYEFPDDFSEQSPILFCQRQNMLWTKKMMLAKSVLFALELLPLIAIVIFIMIFSNVSVFEKIICLLGFAIKVIDRIIAVIKYIILGLKISGILEIQETSFNNDSLIKTQEKINDLRAIPILGKNKLHQKMANRLSKSFKETVV